jgi:hypothetical protein
MRSAGGYWYDAKGSQAVPNFGEPQILFHSRLVRLRRQFGSPPQMHRRRRTFGAVNFRSCLRVDTRQPQFERSTRHAGDLDH